MLAEELRIDAVPHRGTLDRPNLTMAFSLTGMPAIVAPFGFRPDGLPVPIQLAERPFAEATLPSASDAFGEATPGRERRPDVTAAPKAAGPDHRVSEATTSGCFGRALRPRAPSPRRAACASPSCASVR